MEATYTHTASSASILAWSEKWSASAAAFRAEKNKHLVPAIWVKLPVASRLLMVVVIHIAAFVANKRSLGKMSDFRSGEEACEI